MSILYFQIPAGSTSVDIPVPIYDSSSAVGAKLAGLTYTTAGTWYYTRQGAAGAASVMTLVTKTKGTWASLGFVQADNTNLPGDYELGLPDAAIAAGANWVKIQGKGATAAVPVDIFIDLRIHPVNITQLLGTAWLTPGVAGTPDVNAKLLGGTSQTGRDVGASVIAASVTAAVTISDVPGVKKNTALANFAFLMVDSSGNAKTGLTVTSQVRIDAAAFGSCVNSATEVANGIYSINLAAADLNGDVCTFRFSGSGAADRFITVKTNT